MKVDTGWTTNETEVEVTFWGVQDVGDAVNFIYCVVTTFTRCK